MDPVTAAVVLLATKAGEALAGEAGKKAWAGLTALTKLVKQRFSGDRVAELALDRAQAQPDDDGARAGLEAAIRTYVEKDAGFAAELEGLVAETGAQEAAGRVVVQLRDWAQIGKQVNVAGNVDGKITL